MGDSMTAAFGATAGKLLSKPLIPREDRYLSFSGGGGAMQYTVGNFLRLYNPAIVGGAFGRVTPLGAAQERVCTVLGDASTAQDDVCSREW